MHLSYFQYLNIINTADNYFSVKYAHSTPFKHSSIKLFNASVVSLQQVLKLATKTETNVVRI
jgi:hypothetical protein